MKPAPTPTEITATISAEPHSAGLGGLLAELDDKVSPFPLLRVVVRAHLVENVARTTVEQVFQNTFDRPVEAVHIFPLPDEGAVIAMELTAGDLTVRAECRERQEAEKVFEEARRAGHGAGLLTAESADVHTLRVTNIPPGEQVTVRIEFIETLPSADGSQTWRFPTTIAPRYLPGTPIGHDGPGIYPDTDQVPDASRLQPPLRLEGGTELDLQVRIDGRLRSVASSLHAVRLDLEHDDGVLVAPSAAATLDRDFVLSYALDREQDGLARAWTDGQYTLLALEPQADLDSPALPREAVLVIDTSGSMSGEKLAAAKVALKSVLHGLRQGDRFNLIQFNNQPSAFGDSLSDYDQASLEAADRWIDRLQATGGTEMLPAIQLALSGEPRDGALRTVLFITDGQAHNVDELVAAVYHRHNEALFFTLGIDSAVHGALLKRLARAGRGTCTLLTPRDDIRTAVAGLESRFGLPYADELELSAGEPAVASLPALFAGQSAAVLLAGSPKSLTLKARTSDGQLKQQVRPRRTDLDLAPLWARQRVAALEDRWAAFPSEREGLRAEILKVALEHGIASRFTAFVAVHKEISVDGEAVEVVQPVELPVGWDPAFLGGPMPSPQSAPAAGIAYSMAAPEIRIDRLSSMVDSPRASLDRGHEKRLRPGRADADQPLPPDPSEELALRQNANGSYGDDVSRTAAALAALVLLGSTRKTGLRRQAVRKAYDWLKQQTDELASRALEMVEAAESDADLQQLVVDFGKLLGQLAKAGEEGRMLLKVRKDIPGNS